MYISKRFESIPSKSCFDLRSRSFSFRKGWDHTKKKTASPDVRLYIERLIKRMYFMFVYAMKQRTHDSTGHWCQVAQAFLWNWKLGFHSFCPIHRHIPIPYLPHLLVILLLLLDKPKNLRLSLFHSRRDNTCYTHSLTPIRSFKLSSVKLNFAPIHNSIYKNLILKIDPKQNKSR